MKTKNLKMKSINLPYALLISIILGMGYYIIFIQPKTTVDTFDEAPLREEIRIQDSISVYWKYQSSLWETKASALEHKADSLEKLKPKIKIYYEKKYTFNANASVKQLDSLIRANW